MSSVVSESIEDEVEPVQRLGQTGDDGPVALP